MRGLMQERELLISSLLVHAETYHPAVEVVSKSVHGELVRHTWATLGSRIRRLANALTALGVRKGSIVGTLAWNTHRHLELYFAVSGMGAVLHTINPRLFEPQIQFIMNHAQDEVLFFDTSFTAMVERLRPQVPSLRQVVALTNRELLPAMDRVHCYEDMLDEASDAIEWPVFDERTASSLCYTSGTTGNPKGVLYTHRSTLLHTLAAAVPDSLGIDASSVLLPCVNLFHANAWGIPYVAAMTGARLVLLGPHLDAQSLYNILRDERVTHALGVPTIWTTLFLHIDSHRLEPRQDWCLRQVVVGGSAMSRVVAERFAALGVHALHAWGMTETSPLGLVGRFLPKHSTLSRDQRLEVQTKQGRAVWGVELKLLDPHGASLPHDGKAVGRLMVRGPWIVGRYFKAESDATDLEGWFDTGDVATIDPDGYAQIIDRTKDVIKSGGEWIGSIEIENLVAGCPGVAAAAVIGVRHPKWQERPLLVVVKSHSEALDEQDVLRYLSDKIVKWWMPDDVIFVDALPMTATGKVSKLDLRRQFADHLVTKT